VPGRETGGGNRAPIAVFDFFDFQSTEIKHEEPQQEIKACRSLHAQIIHSRQRREALADHGPPRGTARTVPDGPQPLALRASVKSGATSPQSAKRRFRRV
jgi:hypothetical protein